MNASKSNTQTKDMLETAAYLNGALIIMTAFGPDINENDTDALDIIYFDLVFINR